jgi:oxygen-dependent protoporphyrinogen oxidase
VPVGQARRSRFAARAFRPGLCAYRRDHGLFRREVAATLEGLPGLALAGDYMRGASLEACVRSGQEAAERALADRPGGIEDRWTTTAAGPRLPAAAT